MRRVTFVGSAALTAAALVAAPALPASAHTQHRHSRESITIVFVGKPGAPGTVILRGPVVDIGTVTPSDGDTEKITFPDGILRIRTAGSTSVTPPTYPACVVTFRTKATYTVLGGNRRFRNVTGHGASIDAGFALATRTKHQCTEPETFVFDKVNTHGTLHLHHR
jgi:hypothetical protein